MYCTSCGVQASSGSSFCSGCGARLGVQRDDSQASEGSRSPDSSVGLFGILTAKLRRSWDSLKAITLRLSGRRTGIINRAKRSFTEMNLVTRLLLIGIPSLILAILLSPVLAVFCALVAVVSVVVLGFRIKGRKPKLRWGITTGVALALTVLFTGTSGYVYGFDAFGGSRPDSLGSDRPTVETECGIYGCPDENGEYPEITGAEPGGLNDLVLLYPEFEEIIEDWEASGTAMPLFLPTYVPFEVSSVEIVPFDGPTNAYYIWGSSTEHIRLVPIGRPTIPVTFSQGEVPVDGQYYNYTEQTSFGATAAAPDMGVYPLGVWLYTESGEEVMYAIELNSVMNPLPIEEFENVVLGLDRIDPSEAE